MKTRLSVAWCTLLSMAHLADAETPVDFVRDIQPIFKASCIECHDAKKHKADLRLDNRPDALRGGETGPSIIPGHAKDSLLMKRIRGEGDDDRMPVKKPPLTEEEIARVSRWIDEGAVWPASADGPVASKEIHWAYVKPQRPTLPTIKNRQWARNEIDAFVAARFEKEGFDPAPEATREMLIRRVSLDLIGLPPTLAEVDAFLNDTSADSYEKVVDRLLASPHYGERWARPWLDLARYADSNGFEKDRVRSMWPYRDWVIRALNANMGFDEFTIRQIAGDLLENATVDDRIATGFHRNTTLNEEGGVDPEEYRYYAVVDRVNTTAAVWLGTTMGCSQCHNHKYDPFTMKDYYRLSAFFNSTREETTKGGGTDPHDVSSKLTVEMPEVTAIEKELAELKETLKPQLAQAATSQPAKNKIAEVQKRLDRAKLFSTTLVMAELPQPRETRMHVRGGFLTLGDKVTADTPASLAHLATTQPSTMPSRNRLDLARWLVSDDNPLTARVTMNRLWEAYFGRGIVETSEDFGTQGSPPSHAELLDWLAVEFINGHWDLKAMHRKIALSATYRQSSDAPVDHLEKDPSNKWLARGPRFRLEAELLRDQALLVSGLLNRKQGGPSVYPAQPAGIWNTPYSGEKWIESAGAERYRRGIYTFLKRSSPYPMFTTFDATSRESICTRRPRTDTPLQALTILNDPAFVQPAAALARAVMAEGGTELTEKITFAFRRVLIRKPEAAEVDRLVALYRSELEKFSTDPKAAAAMADCGLGSPPATTPKPELAAWTMVANVLLNLDETLTKS